MFKRKKKKTGCETPTYSRFSMAPNPNLGWQPTKSSGTKPPKPPTSGSNAVKPNPNYTPPASVTKPRPIVCAMKLEGLDNWVKTRAQIGDVAYCHDRISDHHYIYHYRKPDDNPVWIMMQPEFLTDYLQKTKEQEHKMEYKIDIDAMIKERLDKIVDKSCPYELPCGWCTKWDKKCDKKIGGYPTIAEPVRKKVESNEGLSCYKCKHHDSISSVCADCHPIFKNFEAKEN